MPVPLPGATLGWTSPFFAHRLRVEYGTPVNLTTCRAVNPISTEFQIQRPAMIEDFEVADCQKNIADPHKDFGLVIEWCA